MADDNGQAAAAPQETAEEKRARRDAERAAAKELRDRERADAKARRDAEKVAKDAERAQAKADKAAEREQTKLAAKQARDDAAKAKADEKTQAAERAKADREASRMPEQNGVRRPKPDTLCGKTWEIFDKVSGERGSPASIGEAMPLAQAQGLNDANTRTEYARWRKFHNVTGRIDAPKPEQGPAAEPAPAAPEVPPAPVAPAPAAA